MNPEEVTPTHSTRRATDLLLGAAQGNGVPLLTIAMVIWRRKFVMTAAEPTPTMPSTV